jgi:hypothetical protein
MCGFQSLGLGLFFFPENSTDKQSKERSSSLVITVIEWAACFKERLNKSLTYFLVMDGIALPGLLAQINLSCASPTIGEV